MSRREFLLSICGAATTLMALDACTREAHRSNPSRTTSEPGGGYSIPPDFVFKLREQGVVGSSTPYATSYVRLGPSIATNPDQVDQAIEAVSSLV